MYIATHVHMSRNFQFACALKNLQIKIISTCNAYGDATKRMWTRRKHNTHIHAIQAIPDMFILLKELMKQHFGVLKLYWWLPTKTRFGHETGPDKSCRADIWCTRLQIALRAFFVSIGTLGFRRFGGRGNSVAFTYQKLTVTGQVWIPHRSPGRINTSA